LIKYFVYFCATQDEKNQVLTTYVWYRQVCWWKILHSFNIREATTSVTVTRPTSHGNTSTESNLQSNRPNERLLWVGSFERINNLARAVVLFTLERIDGVSKTYSRLQRNSRTTDSRREFLCKQCTIKCTIFSD